MSASTLVLYTQPGCVDCETAKSWLADRGSAVRVRDIRAEDAALFEFMDTGARVTPTLVVDGEVLEGFDAALWARALERVE